MTRTPLGWQRIVARLTRALGSDHARTTLGDLLEDYRANRQTMGTWKASWRAWQDARSIARAYTAAPKNPPDGFFVWADAFAHDTRAAIRASVRQSGLTMTVVLVLAFSMAANTALFSIVDGLLFRPLPFRDAGALVQLRLKRDAQAPRQYSVFVDLIQTMETSPLLTGVSLAGSNFVFATDAATDAAISAADVSPGYFELLGLPLHRGRDFTMDDAKQVHPHVVIDRDVWQRHFGADIEVLGRVSTLAERQVVIVGVAPSAVSYPLGANVWTVTETPISQANGVRLWQLGRLAPGVTVDQLRGRFPDVEAILLREAIQPGDTRALVFLLGATLVLLLTACVQVGSLLLARAVGRMSDTAIKLALGISPARLARQHLLDAAVLATLAVGLAWIATPFVTHAIAAQLPAAMTNGQAIDPDGRTLVYTTAAGFIVIALLAFTPWSLTRRMSRETTTAGSMMGVRVRAERWREVLLVAQVACSSLLLCVAGLALHSFMRVSQVDPGFDTANLWQVTVPSLPSGLTTDGRQAARAARIAEAEAIRDGLLALPSIETVGLGASPPTTAAGRWIVYLAGREGPLAIEPRAHRVTPDYLQAMRARLVSGRMPRHDRSPSEPEELLVNRAVARAWPADSDLMTADLQLAGTRGRVVGVIDDLLGAQPGVPDDPRVFMSLGASAPGVLLVRATAGDATIGPAIDTVVSRTWPRGRASRVSRVSDDLARVAMPWRARTVLFGIIAGLCIPMVVAGLCGMLLSSVRHRWREIAIRIALGATTSDVSRSVLWRAWRPVILGLIVGLTGGVLTGRAMSGLLYEIPSTDIATLTAVTVVTLAVTTAAALWPARLASSIAPVEALKER